MENSRVKYKYQHPKKGLLEGEGQFIEYARGTEIINGKLYWITLAVVLDANKQRHKIPADCILFIPPSEVDPNCGLEFSQLHVKFGERKLQENRGF